ncbi:uncharacterized protein LOC135384327 [Ornithodoros turicata]|uniref:uncharacterized protein LOC135384327 n=1 Tax=Ornithodoros turicata TaxID=34597 RepID=UPI00313959DE
MLNGFTVTKTLLVPKQPGLHEMQDRRQDRRCTEYATDTVKEPISLSQLDTRLPHTPSTKEKKSRAFLKSRKLSDKIMRYESHFSFISKHLQNKSIPKGARLSSRLPFANFNATHLSEWEAVLHDASLALLSIASRHCEGQLIDLRKKQHEMTSLLTSTEKRALADFQTKKSNALRAVKDRKMERDLPSAHQGTVQSPQDPTNAIIEPPLAGRSCSPPKSMVNLSSVTLTDIEERLLSKGLSFCPSTTGLKEFQLHTDLENFARKLRLRDFFHDKENSRQTASAFKTGSSWSPPKHRDRHLDDYIQAVQKDILKVTSKKGPPRHNLSSEGCKAFSDLEKRKDIAIKPADKGGAIVVMDTDAYIREGARQLEDKTFYERLDRNPTPDYASKIERTLTDLRYNKKITPDTHRQLLPQSPKPGCFYLLPKIHKPGHPGRPIISGNNTVTENLSTLVDYLIKDTPPTHPSVICERHQPFSKDHSQPQTT